MLKRVKSCDGVNVTLCDANHTLRSYPPGYLEFDADGYVTSP